MTLIHYTFYCILLYGYENWAVQKQHRRKIETAGFEFLGNLRDIHRIITQQMNKLEKPGHVRYK
jgi:hypothetical protein